MKKGMKILAGGTAFILIGGLLWFANGLVGNPISKALATHNTEKYIEAQYPDMGLEIKETFYNFKGSNYYVRIQSPTSIDTHFSVQVSPLGKIEYDDYEDSVIGRWNTYSRIDEDYRSRVEAVFASKDFPYKSDIEFGELVGRMTSEEIGSDEMNCPVYGFSIEDLELDRDYDITELGKTAGHIVLYVEDDEVSVKRAAEILHDVKNRLDKEQVPFYAIDFVLEKSRGEDEKPDPNGEAVRVSEFLYSDIYEEDLEQRIAEAAASLEAYYKEQDAKRQEGISKD